MTLYIYSISTQGFYTSIEELQRVMEPFNSFRPTGILDDNDASITSIWTRDRDHRGQLEVYVFGLGASFACGHRVIYQRLGNLPQCGATEDQLGLAMIVGRLAQLTDSVYWAQLNAQGFYRPSGFVHQGRDVRLTNGLVSGPQQSLREDFPRYPRAKWVGVRKDP